MFVILFGEGGGGGGSEDMFLVFIRLYFKLYVFYLV